MNSGGTTRGNITYDTDNDFLFFNVNQSERSRITSGGDLLLGGHSERTYDDTGDTNVILDIYGGATAGKRGILSLSGRTGDDGGDIGTIWFNNDNNSGASPGSTMKLSAAIQAQIVTSDGNAGNDAGAYLQFFTKPDGGSLLERLRITSGGETEIRNIVVGVTNAYSQSLKFRTTQTNGQSAITGAIRAQGKSGWGGDLVFYTKESNSTPDDTVRETFRITTEGELFQHGTQLRSPLSVAFVQLSGSTSTDSVGSFVTWETVSYTPKRAGNLVVCHMGVQTWWGSNSDESGDIYFRAQYDNGTGTWQNVDLGGNNNRVTGNFDADNRRQHLYYTHTFAFYANNTSTHQIRLQASNTSSLTTNFNWIHTVDNCNHIWFIEYDS